MIKMKRFLSPKVRFRCLNGVMQLPVDKVNGWVGGMQIVQNV